MNEGGLVHPPSIPDDTPLQIGEQTVDRAYVLGLLGHANGVEDFVRMIKERSAPAAQTTPVLATTVAPLAVPAPAPTTPALTEQFGAANGPPKRAVASTSPDSPSPPRPSILSDQMPTRQPAPVYEQLDVLPRTGAVAAVTPSMTWRQPAEEEDALTPTPTPRVKRRKLHIKPPTAVHVSTEHTLDFDVPDYASMDADQRALAINNLQRTARGLAIDHPNMPEVAVDSSNITPSYLRRIDIQLHSRILQVTSEVWAERARVILMFVHCILELIFTRFGFGREFASKIEKGRFMSYYDAELRKIGDMMTVRVGGTSRSNPYLQIAKYTAINAAFFLGVRLLEMLMPAQVAEGMLNMMVDTFMGLRASNSTANATSTAPAGTADGPPRRVATDAPSYPSRPNTTFMGMPMTGIMSTATEMLQGVLPTVFPTKAGPGWGGAPGSSGDPWAIPSGSPGAWLPQPSGGFARGRGKGSGKGSSAMRF